MYIKINGSDEHYDAYVSPFETQHGNLAVRVIGEMPETNKGFKLYNDQDEVFSDFSDYIYLYSPNEYTTVEEEIEEADVSFQPLPPSSYDKLSSRISRVNSQVQEITPYEETKKAYYGEIEKVFYGVPQGNTTLFFSNYKGEYDIARAENRLIVKFPERLSNMTDITVMVNK